MIQNMQAEIIPGNMTIAEWSLKEAEDIVRSVCADIGVRVILFGSRARGTHRIFSDIDIALDGMGEQLPSNLYGELGERFENSLIPYTVDVVDLIDTTDEFRRQVYDEGIVWMP